MVKTKKLVCHLGKFGKGSLQGLQIHNQRERRTSKNPDIDPARTHLNYDLHNRGKINYYQAAKARIEAAGVKRIRKDSNWAIEAELSAGRLFWENATPEEQKRFFQEAYNFMCDRFGKKNILYSAVHLDETTPHMHCGFVPLTKDNRLNSQKVIMHRVKMAKLHQEFYQHMKARGLDIEKGEPAKVKHMEPGEWKAQEVEKKKQQLQKLGTIGQQISAKVAAGHKHLQQLQAEGKRLIQAKRTIEKELQPLEEVKKRAAYVGTMEEEPAGFLGMDRERVKVRREDWDMLKTQAVQVPRLLSELDRTERDKQQLFGQLQLMNDRLTELREQVKGLPLDREEFQEYQNYVQGLELKLDLIEEELELEFELEFEDEEDEQEMEGQPRRRRRSSKRPRVKARRRSKQRRTDRHQLAGQNRRKMIGGRGTKQSKSTPTRNNPTIIDRGRF